MVPRFAIGCQSVDDMLQGGFEGGIVTQLFGESGTGKTNICLQFAKTTLLANSKAIIVYVDTEGLSGERLGQVMGDEPGLEDRLIISSPTSIDEQAASVEGVKQLVASRDVAAIIVDSMTIFYRKDVNTERDMPARKVLNEMMVTVLALARRKRIPAIITNQVYMDPDTCTLMPLGGNVIAHNTKAIIELVKLPRGYRLARLVHHRSIKENQEARFAITDRGIATA